MVVIVTRSREAAVIVTQSRETAVIITHSREMTRITDSVVVTTGGCVLKEGTYDDLLTFRGKLGGLSSRACQRRKQKKKFRDEVVDCGYDLLVEKHDLKLSLKPKPRSHETMSRFYVASSGRPGY